MESVKRIEIIGDSALISDLVQALEEAGIRGYSVIRDVSGAGERGRRSGDDPAGVMGNGLLLTTCPEPRLADVVKLIRPYLKSRGGICLVSDAQWVIH